MFDRAKVRELRDAIQSALDEHLDFDGVKIDVGRASFNHTTATFKLEVGTENSDGSVNTKDGETFKRNAVLWGLSPDDLGKEISNGNDTFEIIGANTRAKKYPILVKSVSNGKVYKMSAQQVVLYMKMAAV